MFLGPGVHKGYAAAAAEITTPYFVDFAARARSWLADTPVIATGGFRRREEVEDAVASEACDMVGLVRPAAVNPRLPKTVIFNQDLGDKEASFYSPRVDPPWVVKQVGVTALNVHMDNVSCSLATNCDLLTFSRRGIWAISRTCRSRSLDGWTVHDAFLLRSGFQAVAWVPIGTSLNLRATLL